MGDQSDPDASGHHQQPAKVSVEVGDSPVSEQDIQMHLDALASPVPPRQPAGEPRPTPYPAPVGAPLPPAPEPITPSPPWQGISILWLLSLASTGLAVWVALSTLRTNPFCSKLGICSVDAIKAASVALERAAASATSLDGEHTVLTYGRNLRDLQQQVEQIDRHGVFNEAQQKNLDRLREIGDQAQRRLAQEIANQQLLLEITRETPGLKSLPWSEAERKRQQLLKQLNQVKPASFSFAAAQSLQNQLQQAEPRPAASAVRPNVPAIIEPGTHYRRKDPPPVRVPDHNWLPDRPEPLW
jgi:hypothetical protein